jgi:uncharacterized membrane protein YphA (DoxX/SURF4 family)
MTDSMIPQMDQMKGAWAGTLARWLLGGLFLYMGLNKALDPVTFLKLVRQYDLVHGALGLNFIAVVIPWLEVFCGLLLISGVAVRGAALVTALMLLGFTLIVLRRALILHGQMSPPISFCAIAFDCGCGTGPVLICRKLVENVLLFLLASALIRLPRSAGCLRFQLFATNPLRRPASQPPDS